jgi:amidase
MLHEIVSDLAEYLSGRAGTRVKTLLDVVEFNRAHSASELIHFGQELFEQALQLGGRSPEYEVKRARNLAWADQTLELGLSQADVLLGCTYGPAWTSSLGKGDDYGTSSWITTVPAVAGTPIGTIPMGLVDGLPVGLGFVVGRNREEQLITAMAQAERALGIGILQPTFLK